MKAFVATVKVLVKASACETQAGACDWFTGLLTENPDVIDWGYMSHKKDPHEVILPRNYTEGDLFNKGAGI